MPRASALLEASERAGIGCVISPRGSLERHLYVSAGMASLLGWELGELEALGPVAYLDGAMLAALAAEPHVVIDGKLRKKDGGLLPARVSKDTSDDGELDVYVFRQVAGPAAEFQRLLAVAPDGVAVLGRHGLLYANPALLRWVGFSDVESLARARMPEVIHTHDVPKALESVRALLHAPGTRGVLRLRVRRASGGLFDVECLGLGTEWLGENACLVVARDLSQRRIDQSRVIAADRRASVGTMSAGVAHEINNPLAYLLLNLEYLLRELPQLGDDPGKQAHLIERLGESRHGAERVGHILRDLSSLSSRRSTRREGVDPAEVAGRALRAVESEAKGRVQVRVDNQRVPLVDADPNGLEQLFVNLLVNAAQAARADRGELGQVLVTLAAGPDGGALIEVRDDGEGIAAEHLNRIFDPFFTTKPSGTGLGLPVSHAIARSFGGTITVESEVGKGTTVRVALPPGSRPKADTVRVSESPRDSGRRARILVVDDDVMVAETVSRALTLSYEVALTTSARQALAMLEDDAGYDVVLCDLLMPDMSGMDLHQALAARSPGLERRLVFMTGGAFTQRAQDFLRRCKNPRIEKPFELERLYALIDQQLSSSEPRT